MISIHLRRTGAKKDPHYRVVVTDSRVARDGVFIEVLGHYHPRYEPAKVVLDVQKTRAWIEKGAQPSDTVRSLLKKVESGTVAVEESVSPSRQRDVVKHAEIRANAPAPKADDADEAPAEAAADDAAEEAPKLEKAPEAASDEVEAAPEKEAASDDAEAAPEEEAAGDKADVASETEAAAEEEVAAPEPEAAAEEEAADDAGEAEEAAEAADEEEEKE